MTKKIPPLQYTPAEVRTNEDIQKEVLKLVADNKCKTYRENLDYVLDSFYNYISSSEMQGGYNDFYSIYQDELKPIINNIKKSVRLYLQGKLHSSFNTFYKMWDKLWGGVSNEDELIYTLEPSTILYKLRKADSKEFSKKDFFHVPFNQRGKIGNNRFSISGYPCLYLGRSIYTCWEEMRRLKQSEISAVAFKVQKPIRLLDLRLCPPIESLRKESFCMSLLPYILASSVRVHFDEDNFKPEYIIPQLLLHSVIRKGNENQNYDGVIYTSTRRNVQYSDRGLEMYDNIVIPVMSNRSTYYCKILASYFMETEPIYLEHELLQGKIGMHTLEKDCKYENTAFCAMENILMNKEFTNIL